MKRLLFFCVAAFLLFASSAFAIDARHAMPPGATPLLPDLITKKSSDYPRGLGYRVSTKSGKKRHYISFETTTSNIGRGPFEIQADPMRRLDCDGDGNDRDFGVRQVVYYDLDGNRIFRRLVDSWVDWRDSGCIYNHKAHDHWHFDDLNISFLVNHKGKIVSRVQKNSWCLMDMTPAGVSLPWMIGEQFYGNSSISVYDNCSSPRVLQGLSPGWSDIYSKGTPGQIIEATSLASGKYCIVTVADQKGVVLESNETNNETSTTVYLNKKKNTVKRVSGSC